MSELIIANIVVLSLIALAAALVLYFAAQKFKVAGNPLADKIAALLPQANCGACGKAGCQDFANACVNADAEAFAHLYCPVGGSKVMNEVAKRLGYSTPEHEPTVAVLHCNGTCENAPDKVEYIGLQSCRLANRAFVGKTGCPNGCLQLGDCVLSAPSKWTIRPACPESIPTNALPAAPASASARADYTKSAPAEKTG